MASLETTISRHPLDEISHLIEDDRRDDSRVKVLKQVRIVSLGGAPKAELATVVDLTREGMYFTTRSLQLTVGTEVRLVFPDSGSECTCVAVRVEELPDGRQGVGVRILGW